MLADMTPSRWADPDVVVHYDSGDGASDAGEQQVWPLLEGDLRGAHILDVGIGAGRTSSRLLPLAGSYTGVDVSEPLLDRARAAHPDADLRLLDAQQIGALSHGDWDVVLWSLNGIDVLDHAARGRFLDDAHALLRPGGVLLFSTHNLDGPSCHELPWHPTVTAHPRRRRSERALRLTVRHLRHYAHAATLARGLRYYAGGRQERQAGDGWALMPLRAHEFRFVCHFVRLGTAVDDLRRRGFDVELTVTNHGERLPVDAERHDADFAHLVCRRRAG